MLPGIMPILHSPGVITPGQLGPIKILPSSSHLTLQASISNVGMPSVIHTISSIPAFAASRIESLQKGAGTYMTEASAPVFFTASRTVLKTGKPRCVVPPFPGVTPPTISVP